MAKRHSQKLRAEFRKKHQGRVRKRDLTRKFHEGNETELDDVIQSERVSGKGELTRKRTVLGSDSAPDEAAGMSVRLDDGSTAIGGRVLSVHGLQSRVLGDDGRLYSCAVRQLLKSLSTDQRHVVAAGDRVVVRPESETSGMIHSVQPRSSTLCRTSRGRQHVIVSNVDCLLIVVSAAQPDLKPGLVDRFLLTAERFEIRPVICINKVDLVDQATLQPVAGVFAQLGYPVLLTSAATGQGIEYLRALVHNREAALAGQSGVGKSSLLNAVEPELGLRVGEVSRENDKGKHTTTAAELIPLRSGGFVVDTPGIRQFQLWDITAEEVAGLMPDLRPYVSHCRYPNCRHLAEDACAVKEAVADGRIDARRYDSYCHLIEEELA
ncbi:ribosome small subunit-dependent GTPase A [Candidatus Laterigemmans baculatus]|uniref:ribosome small subunit-dependent GTPase A n=1 Tax=Candidatus Laterigemmans baculatus TaxID=2770505 RepID=UPI0013DAC0B3|nr:ribosome small subunit-dependent GTPase A [Candidatus Laterigemmans baculatus]